MISLAYECGFNSKSAFNRIFKKHTNLSPTAYMQTQGVKNIED
ncbi:MAG: AraC family transcriptional regulator [Saprospiraceae bacterium]|nr:AraC family transcriptional regulator [Saprospiraceae bacterium]